MLIELLRLENFRSYSDAEIDFEPGVNALIGPNGSGKSSLLEAVGFALFNHQNGKLADSLREGARAGAVTVTLVSSLDGRQYEVERRFTDKTTTRYRVFDLELARQCLAEGSEAVQQWIRDHLRIGPDSDLATLFENTIGVPQGTFTAPFLLPAGQRKLVFDPLLRVQEYRKASDNLRPTVRLLADKASELKAEIARMEGMLTVLPALQDEHKHLLADISRLESEIATLQASLVSLEKELEELAQAETRANQAEARAVKAELQFDAHQPVMQGALLAYLEAERAKEVLVDNLAAHTAYVDADNMLQELETRRTIRDGLLHELAEARADLAGYTSAKAREPEAVRDVDEARERLAEIEHGLVAATQIEDVLRGLERDIEEAQAKRYEFGTSRAAVQALIDALSKQNRFLEDPETGICPTCGTELVPEHREELVVRNRADMEEHKNNLSKINELLAVFAAQISTGDRLCLVERGKLRRLPSATDLQKARTQLNRTTEALARLREDVAGAGAARQVADRLNSELVPYADLDNQLSRFQDQRRENQEAHATYMTNLKLGGQVGKREDKLREVEAEHARIEQAFGEAKSAFMVARLAYQDQRHAQVKTDATNLGTRLATSEAQITLKGERLAEVKKSVVHLEAVQGQLDALATELGQAEDTHTTIQWVRDLLREAGPLVTRRLVRRISQEASMIYGDLIGAAGGRRLRWSDDYEVSLDIHGHRRAFSQLSGGEQMCAALAVRLALLRETSAIDVAFFDEPTAHLDPERRETLADRISQVKGFSQIFVISHDSTFESAAENTIRVAKDETGSYLAG